ncbi:MAG: polymerase subunit sigma-70 [Solirubrobacterales bacterium]|jgi:RNA polymerase sigma-70 factor (TIGR02960 family)|nr:polymerase subunit sigma-70 [Solirubrobacterales bacterium]
MTTSSESTAATDREAFEAQVRRHARELQVHCYRMTGSVEESEDLVQETFLRAWRRREQFAGRSTLRAWLYKIATNACLDALDKRPRTPSPGGEVLWLQPFPDALLEAVPASEEGPEDAVVAKETIELTFITAIQRLQPLPRAVFILRDVLDCSAKEAAGLLETTVASVNSALQRAHAGLREHLPEPRAQWRPGQEPSAAERELLARYVEASEQADAEGVAALLHEDVRFSMPPQPGVWEGRDTVVGCWVEGGFGTDAFGEMRCVLTRANRQPAVAAYVRKPGEAEFRPLAVDVLRIEDGLVRGIVTFDGSLFGRFDLPASLAA